MHEHFDGTPLTRADWLKIICTLAWAMPASIALWAVLFFGAAATSDAIDRAGSMPGGCTTLECAAAGEW